MRNYYRYMLFSFILLLLSGCWTVLPAIDPTSAPLPTATPTAIPEPTTITWAFWGDPWEVEINERIIEVFEADHPHIRVQTFHRPWGLYFPELRAKFDAEEPVPDVLFWAEAPNDIHKGYFMDLAPLMEADDYRLDDFFPGLLKHFKIGNSIYGLPRDSDTKVVFYNKRLFNRAGVDYPGKGWTWQELRQISLALEEAEVAEYSFAYEANDWWIVWMWQNGVTAFDDKLFPTETNLGEPAAAEAVQFLADLTNEDRVTPPYEQLNSAEIASLFIEGKVAMAFGNHALIPAFNQIEGFEWDIVGLPRQERRVNVAAGAGYVIAASTPQVEASWAFFKFLTGPKGQAIFTESGVIMPARRSVAQSDIFIGQQNRYNAQVFLEETEIGQPTPAFPGSSDIMSLLNEAFVPVWHGQQDAAPAIQAVLPKVEAIIAQSQERL